MRANGPFVRLLSAFLLNGFANGFPATLFIFYVSEKLGAAAMAGPLLVLYFVCGVAGVPCGSGSRGGSASIARGSWAMLRRLPFFAPAPFLGEGSVAVFALVCIGTGFALGADLMLPPAIQADVIDVDTAASGEQRSGLYFAAWGLATKLALALRWASHFRCWAMRVSIPAPDCAARAGLRCWGFSTRACRLS